MAGCLPELVESRIGRAIAADSCDQLLKCMRQHENIFLTDQRDNNYLHYACTIYRPKVLRLLLTTELDIDARNKSGNTPLHITAIFNQSCLVPVLMMYGADPYITNNEGKLASDIPTNNSSWKAGFKKYEPGVFNVAESGDGEKLVELIRKWCKTDVSKNGRTLRQWAASRGFHHLLRLMDKYKFTLECIYGVLEQNYDKFEQSVKKMGCDINFLNEGCGHKHIIQYALEYGQEEMVSLLCERGADLNLLINYKDYIKAPLYFSVIGNPAVSFSLFKQVLNSGVDIHAKDERGRNAVMFAMDRAHRARLYHVLDFFLSRGLNLADMDDTGVTVRNLALLNDEERIVSIIDWKIITLIRESEVDKLWRLAEDGYEDFFFKQLWKDTFIYAAGNDTDDVTVFLRDMQQYNVDLDKMYTHMTGDLDELRLFLDEHKHKSHLLITKDKAGRTPLTRAVILGNLSLVRYFLEHPVCVQALNERLDNLYRSSLHYAHCMRDRGPESLQIVELLLEAGADTGIRDACGFLPEDYAIGKPKFRLLDDIGRAYGMEMEMHLLKKYKEMFKVITSKNKSEHVKYKKFLRLCRNLWYPVSAIPRTLMPGGIPLMKRYRDLLFVAIEEGQIDIAKKLVYLGSDCDRQEWIVIDDGEKKFQSLMTPAQYATQRGLDKLSDYIQERKLSPAHKIVLFHRALTVMNDERLAEFMETSKKKKQAENNQQKSTKS